MSLNPLRKEVKKLTDEASVLKKEMEDKEREWIQPSTAPPSGPSAPR